MGLVGMNLVNRGRSKAIRPTPESIEVRRIGATRSGRPRKIRAIEANPPGRLNFMSSSMLKIGDPVDAQPERTRSSPHANRVEPAESTTLPR